jgi:hypothetical protein
MAVGRSCVRSIVDTTATIIRFMMVVVVIIFKRSTEFWIGDPTVRQDERFEEKG